MITPDGPPRQVSVAEMTASGFRVARVRPLLGRPLIEDDERDGAEPVAVIGHEVWESGFSSDPAVLGRRVQLDETFYTVVGVMPAEFAFPVNRTDLDTAPKRPIGDSARHPRGLRLRAARSRRHDRGSPGRSGDRRDAAARCRRGGDQPTPPTTCRALRSRAVRRCRKPARWVGGVILFLVALLLVPPCANIAILVYARTVTRQEEFAARYALGASRGRIVVQIFVEVLVLSAAAGIAGFLLARQFAAQLSSIVTPGMGPQNLPFWMDFTPSLETVLCVAGLAVARRRDRWRCPGPARHRTLASVGAPCTGQQKHERATRQDVDGAARDASRPVAGHPAVGDGDDMGDFPAQHPGTRIRHRRVPDRAARDGGGHVTLRQRPGRRGPPAASQCRCVRRHRIGDGAHGGTAAGDRGRGRRAGKERRVCQSCRRRLLRACSTPAFWPAADSRPETSRPGEPR